MMLRQSKQRTLLLTLLFALMVLILVACGANGWAPLELGEESSAYQPYIEAPGAGSLNLELVSFASGFSSPVSIAHAGDSRLFIVEQAGRIKVLQSDGMTLGTPFLNIVDRVDSSSNEEGLLGLVFHPDYANNGYFYVNYTNTTSGVRRTRISRFSVTADPNVADPASEEILLTVTQPYSNHNAGDIHFGPDGYLYVPLGDGGSGGDPDNNAQTLSNLLGEISRIDVDSVSGGAAECAGQGSGNYTIPGDNPFIDGSGPNCDEIWAAGVRNPWRTSFDSQTGDFYIADVGQNTWEEVDVQSAGSVGGENWGWRCYEGNHTYNTSGCGPIGEYDFPEFEYSHSLGCSITGGYVYRGSLYPNMVGRYFFTDYCTGNFWDMVTGSWVTTMHTNLQRFGLVSFGEAVDGELYLSQSDGTIYHLEDADVATPTPSATHTDIPTATATNTATNTPRPSATSTDTATPTQEATSTATGLPSATSTETPTPTREATSTETATPSPTATDTPGSLQYLPVMFSEEQA